MLTYRQNGEKEKIMYISYRERHYLNSHKVIDSYNSINTFNYFTSENLLYIKTDRFNTYVLSLDDIEALILDDNSRVQLPVLRTKTRTEFVKSLIHYNTRVLKDRENKSLERKGVK